MAARLAPLADLTIQRRLRSLLNFSRRPPAIATLRPGATLYVKIDLKIDNRVKQSAIFIPVGFSKDPDVDLVLFLTDFSRTTTRRSANICRRTMEGYARA